MVMRRAEQSVEGTEALSSSDDARRLDTPGHVPQCRAEAAIALNLFQPHS